MYNIFLCRIAAKARYYVPHVYYNIVGPGAAIFKGSDDGVEYIITTLNPRSEVFIFHFFFTSLLYNNLLSRVFFNIDLKKIYLK